MSVGISLNEEPKTYVAKELVALTQDDVQKLLNEGLELRKALEEKLGKSRETRLPAIGGLRAHF